MRTVGGIILVLIGLYAVMCLVLFLAQRSMIYYPQPRRFGTDASVMKLQVEGA